MNEAKLMDIQRRVLFLCCIIVLSCRSSVSVLRVPGLRNRTHFAYVREAEINIGHLVSIHGTRDNVCTGIKTDAVLRYKAMEFAIDEINRRSDLLPNVTVGFVQLDDCWNGLKALEVAIYLVKDDSDNQTDTYCNKLTIASSDGNFYPRTFDVVGIIGPSNSGISTSVAKFLGTFQLPLMSLYATANSLSDKTQYPYFMRLVPPDLGEQLTLIQIAYRMGWTYVSMVYSAGSYGDGAAADVQNFLRTTAASYGICLAVMARIPSGATDADYAYVVQKLAADNNARVVLTYLSTGDNDGLFLAVRRIVGTDWFVFVGSDTLSYGLISKFTDVVVGSLFVDLPVDVIPGFQEYVVSLTYNGTHRSSIEQPVCTDDEAWFREYWQTMFNCSSDVDCSSYRSLREKQASIEWVWGMTSRVYDGVYVYANAMHNAIVDTCPDAFNESPEQSAKLNKCLDGVKLLTYLKKTRLQGVIGNIQFDANGDMAGDILIYQYQRKFNSGTSTYVVTKIGKYTINTGELQMNQSLFDWSSFRQNSTSNDNVSQPIRSVCSRPCKTNEYMVQLAVSCCWRCEQCRENEIVNANKTGCTPCPEFTWPKITIKYKSINGSVTTDSSEVMQCFEIPPTVLHSGEPLSLVLIVLASACALVSLAVITVYILHRNHRLIKATSRELSAVILAGTLLTSATVIAYAVWPTNGVCSFRSVGFHISINLLYAPLLIKTLRTYRIFKAAKLSVRMPSCVSGPSQIMLTVFLVAIQALLSMISELTDRSVVTLNQPANYINYVELYCQKSIAWFLIPLIYNMMLMVVCAVLGFLSRHLPENFNDSQFIFVSVSTTLFVWILFVPAYFTAYYAYLRSAIIGFCLVSNVGVYLVCQFVRITYAVFFVPTDRIKFCQTIDNQIMPTSVDAASSTRTTKIQVSSAVR